MKYFYSTHSVQHKFYMFDLYVFRKDFNINEIWLLSLGLGLSGSMLRYSYDCCPRDKCDDLEVYIYDHRGSYIVPGKNFNVSAFDRFFIIGFPVIIKNNWYIGNFGIECLGVFDCFVSGSVNDDIKVNLGKTVVSTKEEMLGVLGFKSELECSLCYVTNIYDSIVRYKIGYNFLHIQYIADSDVPKNDNEYYFDKCRFIPEIFKYGPRNSYVSYVFSVSISM